jgi:hypothetical protein
MTTLEAHLKLKGERSPFAILASSTKSRICTAAAKRMQDLITGVEAILEDIRTWLEAILRKEDDNPNDIEIRARLGIYAETMIPRLKNISGALKLVKQRHEDDE